MTVQDSLPKPRLKIKFSCRPTEVVLKTGSCEASKQLWVKEDCSQNVSLDGNKESMRKESRKAVPRSSDSLKLYGADSVKDGFTQSSLKRGPSEVIDSVLNKRQKMDRSLKRYCGNILEALIKHPAALGFCDPVDPVKLNIPDYFSVISKPMDLGTVRAKLQKNMYFTVAEFKDDVRLTFSNAMLYNPFENYFHKSAKALDSIFNTKWKDLEARLKRESLNREESCLASFQERKTTETRQFCPGDSPLMGGIVTSMSISSEEKRKLTKAPGEAMMKKITDDLKISYARPANKETARNIQNSRCPGKVLQKGTVNASRSSCGSVKTIVSLNVAATRCCSCGSLKCQCSPQKGYAYEWSKRSPSARYAEQNCAASKSEHESSLTSNTYKSDPESDVAVSALDEENNCSSPQQSSLGTTAASADAWTPAIDLQLSPKKALRAAMLKNRFADTILKAKQKTLLDHVDKVGSVKLRQEKEKLERQQQEEKARIEDQIRAAKVASSLKAQEEREREREAARIALQKMEKTVEIEDNMKVLRELEMVLFEASQGDRFGNIMERIGLSIKNDYMDYEDEEDGLFSPDWEEGQICN
ncbi:transcription factor GTE9 [Daucus carota subsp. sativus]|uniref:transcription factor GTE9 n=1 Tax=Daucus carota subsp. sativus TaxID=79200 RepID=UPI0007B2C347|nr:PREDICTED: transcription factor GTE9 [Daucus carota subsp. sativus]XP_017230246.1 PREDICTED: transcription factor GTE9 [Daucus carota subsp. sativus]